MAREKPLDLAIVQAWLDAWDERDVFSDAAIQHLQSLIADTHCIVVITLGVGREPHSLVFRVAPSAPPISQLWHQTGVKFERVLQWDGADWVIVGHVIDSPSILKQGKRVCDFTQARGYARWLATRLDCEFIYTYDGSTWGNA
jgi:hypothetical protein